MKKSIICLCLTLAMLIIYSSSAIAATDGLDRIDENATVMDENDNLSSQIETVQEPIGTLQTDEGEIEVFVVEDKFEFQPEPEVIKADEITLEQTNVDITEKSEAPEIDSNSIKALTKSNLLRASTGNPAAGTYISTLTATGYGAQINVTINPGEAIFATLECPKSASLDYDLYLFDNQTNDVVDYSYSTTYLNTINGVTKTVDEGVMVANPYSTARTYSVLVYSASGGSQTDTFKLIIDVTDTYDQYESNENIWHTYQIPYGHLSGLEGSIDAANDHDWFWFQTPSVLDYASLVTWVNFTQGSLPQDLYKFTSNGQFIYVNQHIDGDPKLEANTTYAVCITGAVGNYEYRHYPTFAIASKAYIVLNSPIGQNVYRTYSQGNKQIFSSNDVYAQVGIATPSGAAYHGLINIELEWTSGYNSTWKAWASSFNLGDDGWTNFQKFYDMKYAVGQYNYKVGSYRHTYDLDTIKTTLTSINGTKTQTEQVYHFANSYYEP